MGKKQFRLGIIVGRFQVFHLGHQYMIDKAAGICDTVGVFIGSSQESGTAKNPFTYELREDILRCVYGDTIKIYPLPDIGVGNNSSWGDYVLKNVTDRFGRQADIFISGKEGRRLDWLGSEIGSATAELYVPKTIDISASRLRECFVRGDEAEWKKYTDPKLWNRFDELRDIIMRCHLNKETASI